MKQKKNQDDSIINDLSDKITAHLDKGEFTEARKLVYNKLSDIKTEKVITIAHLELYGCLIDIGCESRNEQDLTYAISFLEINTDAIKEIITFSSYCYTLANAKHGLDAVFYYNNRGVHSISVVKSRFQESISLYWQAYKTINPEETTLLPQILINLSNALTYVSRLVEAIQFLDIVLKKFPNNTNALLSRADLLHFLSEYNNSSVTIALYTQMFMNYAVAIRTGNLPPAFLERAQQSAQWSLSQIFSRGHNLDNLEKEMSETKEEFEALSPFRKFCIDNFLTLTEHGLYCNCKETAKDDIQIGVPFGAFRGYLVPKLELLLNRIKSEFAFARLNFYKSHSEESVDYDVLFSELMDGEIINSQAEMLRTSYRVCYGILDKIALGICKMYELDSNMVFFERFWADPKRKEQLEQKRNFHLNALYSIACDLNTKNGELKHFKDWRNKLEHNLLVLKDKTNPSPDILKIFEDDEFAVVVDITEFREKALHLLQLTRAAIFSYVYCARLETIEHKDGNDDSRAFEVKMKK